jgi:pyruvate dehydrogenase complex dehydrogenase (E1) component
MEVRRGISGPTRTEGSEVAHGSTLARTAVEGPAMRQGRGERESGSRKGCAGRQRAGQRRAIRQRLAHSGVSARRAQAATELVSRKVARSVGGAAVRCFGADPPKGQ